MNEPRTLLYEFKTFESNGIVWLFDDSVRTYLCSLSPSIWAEPLYWAEAPEFSRFEGLPESSYLDSRDAKEAEAVDLDPSEVAADVEERDAWESAREAAMDHLNY